jgi:predicted phage baseplate assembly protein
MTKTNCPCDCSVHPKPLAIDAGLRSLPRQIAALGDFRNAMLSALPRKRALAFWRARGDEDLGVMLLEMWAYVCDVVSFYDETIANETYLRTAVLPPSVRKLVEHVGYRPRPAVGARVDLAVKIDGRQPLLLPAGLAFRSAAFGAEPPQVFELDADTKAHPLLNGWQLAQLRPSTIPAGTATLLLSPANARVSEGDQLLVLSGGALKSGPHRAQSAARFTAADGGTYVQITLDTALASGVTVATARLVRKTATTALWANPADATASVVAGGTTVTLSGIVPQIATGSFIIASAANDAKAFKITAISQDTRVLVAARTIGTSPNMVTIPATRVPVTLLQIDQGWPSGSHWSDARKIVIGFGLQNAGTLVTQLKPTIDPGDPLHLLGSVEAAPDGTTPGNFLAADADGDSSELKGGIDFGARTLNLAAGSALATPLRSPATVYANVAAATRGETVRYELLGIGDGSAANQSFTLKKKPLTYVFAPTAANPGGVHSTLTVSVRGIRWREVPSFFDIADDDEVYIIRQDDDGNSTIMFGDGVRGARLPAGAEVTARYRFGAGAASPPEGGITQLAKPVKGISSVKNPVAAAGGADAEPASNMKTYAPRSALVFGRAVSIMDMEALAAGQPGVTAARADWTWDAEAQQPGVQISYIGAASIASELRQALRGATAPATPIQVSPATAISADLDLDIRINPRYQASAVGVAVLQALTAPDTGLLSPARIGIGKALFRSVIIANVLAVEGVETVAGLLWNGVSFDDFGQSPLSGTWFDVNVTVSALGAQNG